MLPFLTLVDTGSTLTDYATNIGTSEMLWTKRYAKPRMNYFRSDVDPETPEEYIELIEKYLQVASLLMPPRCHKRELLQPTLWHDDLHLNNIYVNLETETITDIIDWQGVKVAPMILQARIPRMIKHISLLPLGAVMPQRPADYDTMSEEAKKREDELLDSAKRNKYYEKQTALRNPRHYAAIVHNDSWEIPFIEPTVTLMSAWSQRKVFQFRGTLMDVVDHWGDLETGVDECPISFADEERELHNGEMASRNYIEALLVQYQQAGLLPAKGIVDPEDYEAAQVVNQQLKEKFLSVADSEEEKAWSERIWPWQELSEGASYEYDV